MLIQVLFEDLKDDIFCISWNSDIIIHRKIIESNIIIKIDHVLLYVVRDTYI